MSDSLNRYTVTREPSGGEATDWRRLRRYENCETKPSQTRSHGFSRIRKLRNEATLRGIADSRFQISNFLPEKEAFEISAAIRIIRAVKRNLRNEPMRLA